MSSNTKNSTLPRSFDIIEVLDLLISDLFLNFSEHSSCALKGLKDSVFYLMKARPSISLKDYLARFRSHTHCSDQVLLLAFIYFDRVIQKTQFQLKKLNVHKLIIIALLVALKYHEDNVHSGAFYAKVSGIRLEELRVLEIEFLELIDYRLYVDDYDYKSLVSNLNALFNIRSENAL